MLGNVARGKVADGAGVGFDHHAVGVRGAHGAARAVVDVDNGVVASADDAVADGDRHRAVRHVLAENTVRATRCPGSVVECCADVLAPCDQYRLGRAVLGDRGLPVSQRRAVTCSPGVHRDLLLVLIASSTSARMWSTPAPATPHPRSARADRASAQVRSRARCEPCPPDRAHVRNMSRRKVLASPSDAAASLTGRPRRPIAARTCYGFT